MFNILIMLIAILSILINFDLAIANIKISEIYPNPDGGSSEEKNNEFIEIFNDSSEIINIKNYCISNKSKKFCIESDLEIKNNEYIVFWRSEINNDYKKEYFQNSALILNNSNDIISIYDNNGDTIDTVVYNKTKEGLSLSNNNWCNITPSSENCINKKSEKNEEKDVNNSQNCNVNIKIEEINPNPIENNESIKIKSYSDCEINLNGFSFYDEKRQFLIIKNETIKNNEIKEFNWSTNILNNSGDSVYIKDENDITIDIVSFNNMEKGELWIRNPNINTNNKNNEYIQNINAGNDIIPISKQVSKYFSISSDEIEIIINEVSFKDSKNDYIELFCKKCNKDLKGLRVVDDNTFLEFPKNTFVKTGEYIVILFGNDKYKQNIEGNIHYFYITKKNLVATDETITILDSFDNIEDGICIANQDGKFSTGEKNDVAHLVKQKIINADFPLNEEYCLNSKFIKKDFTISFSGHNTAKINEKYFISKEKTMGYKNKKPPNKINEDIFDFKFYKINDDYLLLKLFNNSNFNLGVNEFELTINKVKNNFFKKNSSISFLLKKDSKITIEDIGWKTFKKEFYPTGALTLNKNENFFISEIGKNSKFLELKCQNCQKKDLLIFINEKYKEVNWSKQGDFFTAKNLNFPSKNLKIKVVNKESLHYSDLHIEKWHNNSYSKINKEFYWTLKETPYKKNILIDKDNNIDTDNDSIGDYYEYLLGSDTTFFHNKKTIVYEKYMAHIKDNILKDFKFEFKDDFLTFSGKYKKNKKINIKIRNKYLVFNIDVNTKKNGEFNIQKSFNIPKGYYKIDIKTDEIEINNFLKINIPKNPQKDWIKNIQISILPNPIGKDKNKEFLAVQNIGEYGCLNKTILIYGDKNYKLPKICLYKNEIKVINPKFLPSFKNKEGEVKIINYNGKILASLNWKNATQGYWFGEVVKNKIKTYKVKNKKTTKKEIKYIPIKLEKEKKQDIQYISGFIINFSDSMLIIKNLATGGYSKITSNSENIKIQQLESFIKNHDISLKIKDGNLDSILIEKEFFNPIKKNILNFTFLILIIMELKLLLVLIFIKKIYKKFYLN